LSQNMVTSYHHASGRGYGTGDGETVAHPAEKLRQTIIPKDDEKAKAVIAAAQKNLNNLKFLLGDKEPSVQAAQDQLDMVKPTNAAGMNLFDLGALVLGIMHRPTQTVARLHDATKPGGLQHKLRAPAAEEAPQGGQESQEPAQGEPQGASQASNPQTAAPAAPGAPQAVPAAPQAGGPAPQAA
jgi:hypothetical protein